MPHHETVSPFVAFRPASSPRMWLMSLVTLLILSPVAAEESAISYDAEIKPIFRDHCLGCHNGQARKGDLALDSYAGTMEGGASGEVVYAGDSASSRLWLLASHEEEPVMPPNGDRIDESKLALIRRWIEEGAAERAGTATETQTHGPALQTGPAGGRQAITPARGCVSTTRSQHGSSRRRHGACHQPRGSLIALGGQRQALLYQTKTAELCGVVPYPEGTPQSLRFSRDGSLLLVAGGRGAHSGCAALYDVRSGTRLARLGDELDAILTADVDASVTRVAIGGTDRRVKLIATATGEIDFEIDKHTDWVTAVEFSPDGRWLATADRAGALVLWEAATAREYAVLEGHQMAITAISWRRDGQVLATSGEDGNVRIWDPEKVKPVRSWAAHPGGATSVQFATDGSLVSGGRDRQAKHWDAAGKLLKAFPPTGDIILSVGITSDGQRVFAGDWLGNVTGWPIAADEPAATLAANPPTLEERLAAAQTQVAAAERQVAAGREACFAAESNVHHQQQAWAAAVAQFAALQARMAAAAQEIAELSQWMQSLPPGTDPTERASSLKQSLTDVASASVELQTQIADTLTACQQARNELEKQTAVWKRAQARLADSQLRVAGLTEELQAFSTAGQRWQDELTQANAALADLNRRLVDVRQRLAGVAESLAEPRVHGDSPVAAESETTTSAASDEEHAVLAAELSDLEQQWIEAENAAVTARERFDFFQAAYGTR